MWEQSACLSIDLLTIHLKLIQMIMKKLLLLLFLLISFLSRAYSQLPFVETTYGSGIGVSIDTAAQGYLIGANSNGARCVLFNQTGDTVQTFNYPGCTLDCARQTPDGGYIIMGDNNWEAGLYKIDNTGAFAWNHIYPASNFETYANSVIIHPEGGLFVSYTENDEMSYNPFHVLRTNDAGDVAAQNTVVGSIYRYNNIYTAISLTADSGLITVSDQQGGEPFTGCVLKRMNPGCGTVFTKTFYDVTNTIAFHSNSVIETNDGGYLISGYKSGYPDTQPYNGLLIRTDANGDSLWTKQYSFPGTDLKLIGTIENAGGELFSAGNFGGKVLLIKSDANGDTLWTRTFTGDGYALPNAIIADRNDNPMIVGWTNDGLTGDYIYVISVDAITGINQYASLENRLEVYPNPANDIITISTKAAFNNATLKLVNSQGHLVMEKTGVNGNSINMEVLNQPCGLYIVEIRSENCTARIKVVKN